MSDAPTTKELQALVKKVETRKGKLEKQLADCAEELTQHQTSLCDALIVEAGYNREMAFPTTVEFLIWSEDHNEGWSPWQIRKALYIVKVVSRKGGLWFSFTGSPNDKINISDNYATDPVPPEVTKTMFREHLRIIASTPAENELPHASEEIA